jgi:hypothetical protein
MTIYIFNFIMIGIYSAFFNLYKLIYRNTKKAKIIFVSIVTVQLILILSLRHYSVGVDTFGYIQNFKLIFPALNFEQFLFHRHEIGYKILIKLIYFFTDNEQFFLSIIAIISIIPISITIYRYSKMPF